ncbi:Protein of unknown function DUF2358 [Cynara cardunculus var. scolymus]|uniref:Uncharacterized protein n=1 Tax=Cynara cardunculus var. scolymus TaxID=59895 RepID=A0A124SBM7_CYNCS|nr:Protein of unknown function DUF2358 [Cynara cardunculus var. scolymus]
MAVPLSPTSLTLHHSSNHRPVQVFRSNRHLNFTKLRCSGERDNSTTTDSSTSSQGSDPGNLMLKTAWYGSELLGIAASFFRSPEKIVEGGIKLAGDGDGVIDRSVIVETIKGDFQRSYFVTGAVTLDAYEDDCEFADPAEVYVDSKEIDKGIGHWRFSCTMSFPWKPILSATGYTEYYLSKDSGKVCRHVEHWNVPKMALFKQLLKPSRGLWGKKELG